MKRSSRPARDLVAAALAALAAVPSTAGSTSAPLAVSLTVEPSCHLQTRPLMFSDAARVNAETFIALTCTPAIGYLVSMDGGQHAAKGARRMADPSGTRFVAYELYSDPGRTRRWGASAAQAIGALVPDSGLVELAVYARLTSNHAQPGAYHDIVTVTVAF